MRATTNRDGAEARSPGIRARAVVVAGPPASGKTTLGAALADALHYALFDLDTVTGRMTRAALALAGADESALQSTLGDRVRDARYGSLLDVAAANLALGLGAVVCAPFTEERGDADRFARVVERLGCEPAEVALVSLELSESERLTRIRERGAARDAVAPVRTGKVCRAESDTPSQRRPIPAVITLDAAAAPHDLLRAALNRLTSPATTPAPSRC